MSLFFKSDNDFNLILLKLFASGAWSHKYWVSPWSGFSPDGFFLLWTMVSSSRRFKK